MKRLTITVDVIGSVEHAALARAELDTARTEGEGITIKTGGLTFSAEVIAVTGVRW